jgi:Divergent CRAL/TRIO domain
MDSLPDGYVEELRRAQSEDFSDVRALDVVRVWSGRDIGGRPVIVVTPQNLGSCGRERAFRYFISECNAVLSRPYHVVLVHSGRALGLELALWIARRVAFTLPPAYRKNIAALSIVHPDMLLRFLTYLLSPFVSAKLWDKVQFVDRIEELELDGEFHKDDLGSLLPPLARRFEGFLEGEAEVMRSRARLEGLVAGASTTGGLNDGAS